MSDAVTCVLVQWSWDRPLAIVDYLEALRRAGSLTSVLVPTPTRDIPDFVSCWASTDVPYARIEPFTTRRNPDSLQDVDHIEANRFILFGWSPASQHKKAWVTKSRTVQQVIPLQDGYQVLQLGPRGYGDQVVYESVNDDAVETRAGLLELDIVHITSAIRREHGDRGMKDGGSVDLPRQATRENRRRIADALVEHYDEAQGWYRGCMSDERLATALKVPRAWVSEERDRYFGDDRSEATAGVAGQVLQLEERVLAEKAVLARLFDDNKAAIDLSQERIAAVQAELGALKKRVRA